MAVECGEVEQCVLVRLIAHEKLVRVRIKGTAQRGDIAVFRGVEKLAVDRHDVESESTSGSRQHRHLTAQSRNRIVRLAPIHAQPLETPPQPESKARQRGADSRVVSSILCVTAARCWGEHRGVPKEIDDAYQQRLEAPRSRSHEEDG
jgi:hypothetical protein